MKSLVVYMSIYTENKDGKNKTTGIALHLDDGQNKSKDFITITNQVPYGQLALTKLNNVLTHYALELDIQNIKVIVGQDNLHNVMTRLERILIKCHQKKVYDVAGIEKLVYIDGHWMKHNIDPFYVMVVQKLLELQLHHNIFFEQHKIPSTHTFSMVQKLHKQIKPLVKLVKKETKTHPLIECKKK